MTRLLMIVVGGVCGVVLTTVVSAQGGIGALANLRGKVDAANALVVMLAGSGASSLKYTSAGSTEDEHAVKASAGVLYSVTATNTNAEERYFRCANATMANTTPGTTTTIIDLAIPGPATGGGFHLPLPSGIAFSTALTCWLVTGAADSDVAEVAANEIKLLYSYR